MLPTLKRAKTGTDVRVWAPRVKSVALQTAAGRVALEPSGGGWWSAGPLRIAHGEDYSFVLDGGQSLPDPRSPWQPHGVHAASRAVDHARYNWTDQAWQAGDLSSAILYELHVGTFTREGTYAAAAARLDHLADLGITHIELMPLNEFA